jgi:hypothetical protein
MKRLYEDIYDLAATIIHAYVSQDGETSPIGTYDCYRALNRFNGTFKTLLVHYLPISLDAEYLQNSSFGTPLQKWRYFTNQDFEQTTQAAKSLALSLRELGYQDDEEFVSIVAKQIRSCKQYYGFFQTEYDGGIISEEGERINTLSFETSDDTLGEKPITLDISTFEKKSILVRESETIYRQFVDLENQMRQLIMKRFTIEDILFKEHSHSVKRGVI